MIELADAVADAHHGKKVMVRCPAHDDGSASLHVGPGKNQPVVLHCHAGCETPDILSAGGVEWDEISKPKEAALTIDGEKVWTPAGDASHIYSYVDEEGTEVFQVLRVPQPNGKKTFRQRHMLGERWVWNVNDVRRVLYRLPEVKRAIEQGITIYLVEGEKDVETMRSHGFVATCNPMGAGKWQTEYSEMLRGGQVVIITDADETGRRHARYVQQALQEEAEVAASVMEPAPGSKDVTEHIANGGTIATLVEIRTESEEEQPNYALYLDEMVALTFPADDFIWPNTLAREERVILTGHEGVGKAELMRQFAVTTVAGVHPFTGERMPPRRVLYIDAQDPEKQQQWSWGNLRRVARAHGLTYDSTALQILSVYRHEPDLLTLAGADWLYERIMAHKPDLICMGPVQNLAGRDVKDDEVVRKFKATIDNARTICGSAFVIEHHAPYKSGNDKERPVRPYGSSLFLKWPDFGYGLRPTDEPGTYDFHPNRLPRVRRRTWPERVRWGQPNTAEWPWVEAPPDSMGGTVHNIGRTA